jgi:hypothetical protein
MKNRLCGTRSKNSSQEATATKQVTVTKAWLKLMAKEVVTSGQTVDIF